MTIRKNNSGYTLIELIVSTALIGIVASLLVYILVAIIGVLGENRVRKQLLMDGYNATSKFVREFELVDNESDLLLGYSNQIQFITNIEGSYYTITYLISGTDLYRTVGSGSPVLISTNVTGQFEYYTKDHTYVPTPLTTSAQLRSVRRVRLSLNMISGGSTLYVYNVDAFPENYRYSGGGS